MAEKRDFDSEHSDLLRQLLEQSKYQNQLLGRLTSYLDVMVCQLEKISKQTCESLNEHARQTELQRALYTDLSLLLKIYVSEHAESAARVKEVEDLQKRLDECCPDKKEKEKDKCLYEPCKKEDEAGPRSGDLKRGQSLPGRVEGAPYEPVVKKDEPKKAPNYRPSRKVPTGKFKGLISQTKGSVLKTIGSGDDAPDPVIFATYRENTVANLASANAADISGADSGTVVMLSGNWYAQYSTDGGQTFTTINPTAVFPNTLAGGFCCDQILQYVPQIDRFIWLLQYNQTAAGDNAYRIASASPEQIIGSNCTAWTYWDLTSGSFGLGTDWMDYPTLSVGNNSLYLSFDVLDTVGDTIADNGLLVVRIPLNEIQAGGTINFQFTNPADSLVAWGGNVSQNTLDEVFWAGHVDNSTIRIFNMREGVGSYSWRDVDVANWANANQVSNGPNGNNWFGHNLAAGWQFPGFSIIGATRRGSELWLAWTASNGDGGFGGFNFPHPYVRLVKINIGNYSVIEEMAIWNPDHAFGYPSLATNSQGEVGITLGWGGGGTLNANSAVGILGDYVVWYRNGSTWTHSRWGDYVTVRQATPDTRLFAGFGFVTLQDSTTAAGHRFDPYYVLFGRKSYIPEPPG